MEDGDLIPCFSFLVSCSLSAMIGVIPSLSAKMHLPWLWPLVPRVGGLCTKFFLGRFLEGTPASGRPELLKACGDTVRYTCRKRSLGRL